VVVAANDAAPTQRRSSKFFDPEAERVMGVAFPFSLRRFRAIRTNRRSEALRCLARMQGMWGRPRSFAASTRTQRQRAPRKMPPNGAYFSGNLR
jgi:hypothetical protein